MQQPYRAPKLYILRTKEEHFSPHTAQSRKVSRSSQAAAVDNPPIELLFCRCVTAEANPHPQVGKPRDQCS
jgi:hypothetical protein